ncbi:HdeD family acid-resistance protein [Rothia nasimurium]|uniref:HdeD family acid-resistance protein n=1 Tax=Rothia nasimurium TaxID=85336 RepID=UPI003BA1B08F
MTSSLFARPLFITGSLAIVLGLMAIIWPGITLSVIAVMWGIFALIEAISTFSRVGSADKSGKFFYILSGVIGILAGLAVILQPLWGAATLTWVLGFWLMVRGIIEIVAAIRLPKESPKAYLILAGVLWLLAGLLVMASPGVAMISMIVWIGLLTIILGITLIVAGFKSRSAAKRTAAL